MPCSVSCCTVVDLLAECIPPNLAADQKFVLWVVQVYEKTVELADHDKALGIIQMTSTLKRLFDEGHEPNENVVNQLLERVAEVRQRIEAPYRKK